MKLSKFFISFLFLSVFLPHSTSAYHTHLHSIEQLQAQIQVLQERLQSLIDQTETPPTQHTPPPFSCLDLQHNLYLGAQDRSTNGEVSKLQGALAADRTLYPEGLVTGYYGVLTERAVQRWQAKLGIVNSGNSFTTGYGAVGPMTRTRFKEACYKPPVTSNTPPVIKGISGPATLEVGEKGRWKIEATDAEKGTLSYSVNWEGNIMDSVRRSNTSSSLSQTATFTHEYSRTGVHRPVFTVTDTEGLSTESSISIQVTPKEPEPQEDPLVSVTSPNGGEVLRRYFTHRIKWEDNKIQSCLEGMSCTAVMPAYYDIRLLTHTPPCEEGAPCSSAPQISAYTIATGVYAPPENGEYVWNIGEVVGYRNGAYNGLYKIEVCRASSTVCDQSDNTFEVVTTELQTSPSAL